MRLISRVLALSMLMLPLSAVRSDAVTIRDVVELSKAGLSDDVLVALIEVDQSVFSIDAATLKMLKQSGVSEPVIVAMIRSGRTRTAQPDVPEPAQPPVAAPDPQPQVIVIDHHDAPVVREVPVPVAVPVFIQVPRFRSAVDHVRIDRLDAVAPQDIHPEQPGIRQLQHQRDARCAPPVYWGFGGQLRPGSWEPPQICR